MTTKQAGRLGGKARAATVPPEKLAEYGRKGGKKTARLLSKAERSESARRASVARWSKKKKAASGRVRRS